MNELRAGDQLTIRKLKYRNPELWMMWQWDEIVWHANDDFFVGFETPGQVFGRADKTFIGTDYAFFYFYPRQPFYFYELYLPEPPHLLKSWYCNINALPQRTPDGYSFIDLDLDIWLYPDLTYDILDEDEYRAHSTQYQYTTEMRETVAWTIKHLQERIACAEFPFRRNVQTLETEIENLGKRFNTPTANLQALVSNLHVT